MLHYQLSETKLAKEDNDFKFSAAGEERETITAQIQEEAELAAQDADFRLGKEAQRSQGLEDGQEALAGETALVEGRVEELQYRLYRHDEAASGDLVLAFTLPDEDIAAADLNAAAPGGIIKSITVRLENAIGLVHTQFSFPPTTTGGKSATPAAAAAPTLNAGSEFSKGVARVYLTPDTDAGATITYTPGDTFHVDVQVAADDKLLGWSVALVTKTYTVV